MRDLHFLQVSLLSRLKRREIHRTYSRCFGHLRYLESIAVQPRLGILEWVPRDIGSTVQVHSDEAMSSASNCLRAACVTLQWPGPLHLNMRFLDVRALDLTLCCAVGNWQLLYGLGPRAESQSNPHCKRRKGPNWWKSS